ncbi:MAG: hypothetical protein IIU43_09615 [Thermoguttaceae bacterium]|nr:hypothetical protein [Thermoguttaceae bacterium]
MYVQKTQPPQQSIGAPSEQIEIWLDGRGARLYYPGETLSGSFSLSGIYSSPVEAVEVSILWRTEGKGNEDVGVHEFWRLTNDAENRWLDPLRPNRFSSVLPKSPLSYDGCLIKLRWYAHARAFLSSGKQLVDETPFRLGDLPDMRALKLCSDPELY